MTPVVLDELAHDKRCEHAQELVDAQIDALLPGIQEQIEWGEYDADLASYFDSPMLGRIARTFATNDFELAYSLCSDDLLQIRIGLEEYARDMAERRAAR